jgi:hypothetical protein
MLVRSLPLRSLAFAGCCASPALPDKQPKCRLLQVDYNNHVRTTFGVEERRT